MTAPRRAARRLHYNARSVRCPGRALVLLACGLAASIGLDAAAPLTGAAPLARAYDAVLDADFEEARRRLDAACPPAPPAACLALEATRLLWRIQLDPEQTAHDRAFEQAAAHAIAEAQAWAAREPENAEAWFYVGGAYGARVQWKVLRRHHLSAARDGKEVKRALDRTLALDSTLDDAQFGLGLYEYYAAVAPAAARILRVLLFLPGGDRVAGLKRMEQTRTRGVLLADEAAYQIHVVYLWYEDRPRDALTLAQGLVTRHPRNPFFHRIVAETLDVYIHDRTASLAAYRELAALSAARRVNHPALAETEARLGVAAQLDALGDSDLAAAELARVAAARPAEPWAAESRARLALAQALDRVGDRTGAETNYRQVIAAMHGSDPLGLADAAKRGLARRTPRATAEANRLALAAWREFERRPESAAEIAPRLAEAIARDPANHVARYRYARVLLAANGDRTRALAELDRVVAGAADAPPTVVADAALAAGRVREELRDRAGALASYRRAAHTFGAAAETRDAAARAVTRLERITP